MEIRMKGEEEWGRKVDKKSMENLQFSFKKKKFMAKGGQEEKKELGCCKVEIWEQLEDSIDI